MTGIEQSNIKIDRSSDRNFGFVFTVIFLLVWGYLYLKSGEMIWWPLVVAGSLFFVSIVHPALLKHPNFWWFKFGILLGSIVAPVVMALVYLITFVPLGLFIRVTGKDLLRTKLDSKADSYWIERETPLQPMKNQF